MKQIIQKLGKDTITQELNNLKLKTTIKWCRRLYCNDSMVLTLCYIMLYDKHRLDYTRGVLFSNNIQDLFRPHMIVLIVIEILLFYYALMDENADLKHIYCLESIGFGVTFGYLSFVISFTIIGLFLDRLSCNEICSLDQNDVKYDFMKLHNLIVELYSKCL